MVATAGAPTAILNHEAILRVETTYNNCREEKTEGAWEPNDLRSHCASPKMPIYLFLLWNIKINLQLFKLLFSGF